MIAHIAVTRSCLDGRQAKADLLSIQVCPWSMVQIWTASVAQTLMSQYGVVLTPTVPVRDWYATTSETKSLDRTICVAESYDRKGNAFSIWIKRTNPNKRPKNEARTL